jgi:uncharacterized protein
MTFDVWFSQQHPEIPLRSCAAVLKLVSEDEATVPFIARYRKEQTGNLDEVAIQKVIDAKESWDKILKRQEFILGEIEHQKKLTPELKEKISTTFDLNQLEDLYLPYKQKRKTKAALAREAGLEPLAQWIWDCAQGVTQPEPGQTLEIWAFTFRNEEKEIKDSAAAIQGAQDILIERLSEVQELRQKVRDALFKQGGVRTGKGPKAKPNSKFENYFTYFENVEPLLQPQNSHRYLAIRRGWMEEELTLALGGSAEEAEAFEKPLIAAFESHALPSPQALQSPGAPVLQKAARLAYKAHVFPSIESEVHKALKAVADEAAIHVFAENLRKLLLAAPFGPKGVLGVDPGLRTGCKLAVVDDSGKFLGSAVMHLQSDREKQNAKVLLGEIAKNGIIRAIAVGNGTAGRETEGFIRATLKELGSDIPVVMVSESGASVYSASDVAREEFPDLDVTVRGAISIARRLQDPLAELVKVDPKSIGVGQYQHDVAANSLKRSLDFVVESCVNSVGVSLNTASYHLLSHVAGIGPGLAKSIVEHRGQRGLFKSRTELLEVPRFSKKAFEQAAGFLRIAGGENPLDSTGVHPERYSVLEEIAQTENKRVHDLMGAGVTALKARKDLREKIGAFTFDDIIQELEKPGRDPREQFVPFSFRDDIHEVKDLVLGMVCPGIVTNVTNFGAFVDIGVHQDGLVHISQLAEKFVKDPREVVSPGDHVQVKVLEVNLEKNQIALTLKLGEKTRATAPTRDHARPTAGRASPGPGPRPSGAGPRPPQPGSGKKPSAPRPQPAFNNAFAGLAALRKDLKPGK